MNRYLLGDKVMGTGENLKETGYKHRKMRYVLEHLKMFYSKGLEALFPESMIRTTKQKVSCVDRVQNPGSFLEP